MYTSGRTVHSTLTHVISTVNMCNYIYYKIKNKILRFLKKLRKQKVLSEIKNILSYSVSLITDLKLLNNFPIKV